MLSIVTRVFATVLCLCVVVPAEAALISRLGGAAAYDDVLDITWTSNADINGSTGWVDQVAWAFNLDYLGFDDWRLASMSVSAGLPTGKTVIRPVDCSSSTEGACRDNELGYMYYYNLTPDGDTPPTNRGTDLTGDQTVDGVDLTNIRDLYWSGTEVDLGEAWDLAFRFGSQTRDDKGRGNYGWAVRSGDVAVVPLPSTVWLLATGLIGVLGAAGRKRRR